MATHVDALRREASALPQAPGVYFWKDAVGRVLYIGKAVNLRSRVSSYFTAARHERRVRDLLGEARSITFEVTSTELEALFRESALIKREQPRYNRLLKHSRPVPWLRLDGNRLDPYLEVVMQREDDGSLYFGPFPNRVVARETLAFLHDVLPLRKCTAAKPRCRPCMYYQMHKCAAPLLDAEHRRRHEEAVARLVDLLDGRTDRVFLWLEAKRNRLSELLLFEQAAEIQQRLDALGDIRRQQGILRAAIQCRCVLVLDDPGDGSEVRVLLVAQGHVLSVRPATNLTGEQLVRWVRAHDPVIRAARHEQSEIDAATVFQRWLRTQRNRVRWVAVPADADDADLHERSQYLLAADDASTRAVGVR